MSYEIKVGRFGEYLRFQVTRQTKSETQQGSESRYGRLRTVTTLLAVSFAEPGFCPVTKFPSTTV